MPEPALPHPLSEPLAELIARRFRVLGDPMRIKLLDRLRFGEATVQELTEASGSSQQNVSKHLRVLLAAGVVGRRQEGNFARYAVADEGVFALCDQVCGAGTGRLALAVAGAQNGGELVAAEENETMYEHLAAAVGEHVQPQLVRDNEVPLPGAWANRVLAHPAAQPTPDRQELTMLFTRNKTTQLSPAEVADGTRAGELVLVDVRESDERAQSRPADSRHIPLGDLPARMGELPHGRTVAFICRSGSRSAMAARAAADRGLSAVNVRGGLLAWTDAGLPVDSGPERRA